MSIIKSKSFILMDERLAISFDVLKSKELAKDMKNKLYKEFRGKMEVA